MPARQATLTAAFGGPACLRIPPISKLGVDGFAQRALMTARSIKPVSRLAGTAQGRRLMAVILVLEEAWSPGRAANRTSEAPSHVNQRPPPAQTRSEGPNSQRTSRPVAVSHIEPADYRLGGV
ncbi:hypothetical protein P171DRAFT_479595 [Karstenula rhodostoma CBS 690.94]|uniref:Uncharacterized protein n=1 Tax=Karstenula rhodostoma CBS 690.94 TaxID=1392251 RepID=A0A9P4PUH8_9PLEO|nr:hypothetical protein P171DRAFT_479595 [Karstenula rhodostoma CBS 690.94]